MTQVDIQKDGNGNIWINNETFYVDETISSLKDIYTLMDKVGVEILPEEVYKKYKELLIVGFLFSRNL